MSHARTFIESFEPRLLLADTGYISGSVFFDLNRNGIHDSTEGWLKDQQVFADLNHDGSFNGFDPWGQTNKHGNWAIYNLPAGTYTVQLELFGHAVPTTPAHGGTHTITLQTGEARENVVFGATTIGTVEGSVGRDRHGDGERDGDLANRIVYADINQNGKFDRTIDRYTRTIFNGDFSLSLYAGTYTIRTVL